MSISDYFEKAVKARQLSDESCPGADYCDEEETAFILLRNFDETVLFLQNANIKEIACAIDVLEDLVLALPKKQASAILEIFKAKLAKFPNVQDFCASVYKEELHLAQEIINAKSQN